jgi:hypothetical protein
MINKDIDETKVLDYVQRLGKKLLHIEKDVRRFIDRNSPKESFGSIPACYTQSTIVHAYPDIPYPGRTLRARESLRSMTLQANAHDSEDVAPDHRSGQCTKASNRTRSFRQKCTNRPSRSSAPLQEGSGRTRKFEM